MNTNQVDWPSATPAAVGVDESILNGELSELLGDTHTGAAALVVGGKLVWERYWPPFGRNSRFDTMSIGKAYAAAAIGLLQDDGKLSVDDPACKYLPEWAGDGRKAITIRHLLTMTSGLRLDYELFNKQADPTAAALAWPLDHPPGEVWCYEQATAHALLPIILRVSGQQPIELLRDRILGPMGAASVGWRRAANGDCLTWRSVLTSARDLCRFGWLLHEGGAWNPGAPGLLSREFVSRMTSRDALAERARTDPRQQDYRRRSYGWMLFCNADGIWDGVGRRCFAPLGAYGNLCLVDVDKHFVFARMSTPEDFSDAAPDANRLEDKLDVTDQGTSLAWRTVLKAFR